MSLCCDLGHCSKLGSECSFFVNQAPNAVFLLQNDPMQFISLLYQVNLTGQQTINIAIKIKKIQ